MYTIELAVDTEQGFAEWLNNLGHETRIGNTTGNYVDGRNTSSDPEANEIMRNLWEEFCNA